MSSCLSWGLSQLHQSQNAFFRAPLDLDPLGFLLFPPNTPLPHLDPREQERWGTGLWWRCLRGYRKAPESPAHPCRCQGRRRNAVPGHRALKGAQPSAWSTREPRRWGWEQSAETARLPQRSQPQEGRRSSRGCLGPEAPTARPLPLEL